MERRCSALSRTNAMSGVRSAEDRELDLIYETMTLDQRFAFAMVAIAERCGKPFTEPGLDDFMSRRYYPTDDETCAAWNAAGGTDEECAMFYRTVMHATIQ